MTFKNLARYAALALALASGPAFAQSGTMPMMQGQGMPHGMDHSGHMAAPAGTAASPSTTAFAAANDKMHKDMAIAFTGEADVDFARGMIPHHQGAIDMARIELLYGKDPELRKLAEEIVKAQESEIAFLKAWLAKAGK